MSEWRIMERGCPQGSSFGPLLWNMFQNDMAFHIPDSNLTLYADDHQLYVTGKTYEEVESTLKTQGQQALTWYRNNFLLANSNKFQSLTINPRTTTTTTTTTTTIFISCPKNIIKINKYQEEKLHDKKSTAT